MVDAKNVLAKLVNEYRALGADPARLEEWWQRIHAWQERYPLVYDDSSDHEIKPQRAIQALYEATGGDAIVTSDVGQHQMWAAQYYGFTKPRRWINSGGSNRSLPASFRFCVQASDPSANLSALSCARFHFVAKKKRR